MTERPTSEDQLTRRVRLQAAVAQLGLRALQGADLPTLMDETVARLAPVLEVEFCKILEWLPGDAALLLKAGVGWKPGLVGHATVSAGTESQAGYTLLSSAPVIVEDLRAETRFHGPPLLHEHGVVSGMSVIIHCRHQPYGVLGAHTTQRRAFAPDDVHFLQAVANVLGAAIDRSRIEAALRESQSRFAAFMDNWPGIAFIKDAQGRYLFLNRTVERIFQLKPGELPRQNDAAFFPETSVAELAVKDRQVMETGRALQTSEAVRCDNQIRRWLVTKFPIADDQGRPLLLGAVGIDITDRQWTERLLATSRQILELILTEAELPRLLNDLCEQIDKLSPGLVSSILLLDADGKRLWPAAGPQLPEAWCRSITPLTIGPGVGSCGTAAYRKQLVFVSDIRTDPLWIEFRDLAMSFGFRACWSAPIFSAKGEVLGTFAMYYREPRHPGAHDLELIAKITPLAALAIEHDRTKRERERLLQQLRDAREKTRRLTWQVINAHEEERRYVSRVLHDQASQTLTALRISLELLRGDVPPELGSLQGRLKQVIALADLALDQIRTLGQALRPPSLSALGLNACLEGLCRGLAQHSKSTIEYRGEDHPSLPDSIQICLYRFLQAALADRVRQGQASPIKVVLALEDRKVRLVVEEAGDGRDPQTDLESSPHPVREELSALEERLHLLGGSLEIEPGPKHGLRLIAQIPTELVL